jgi:hypothetical protein
MDKNFWSSIKLPDQPFKKFTITVEGKVTEVDLETKIQIDRIGEHNFTWKEGQLVRKPALINRGIRYPQLHECDNGYKLLDGHAYWPLSRVKKGKNFLYE